MCLNKSWIAPHSCQLRRGILYLFTLSCLPWLLHLMLHLWEEGWRGSKMNEVSHGNNVRTSSDIVLVISSLGGPLKYFSLSPGPQIYIFWSTKGYFKVSRVPPETSDPYLHFRSGNIPRSQVSWCISPARVGNVILPTPSQFLRHIRALPQTWCLVPRDRYRLEISGFVLNFWKCWIPDPNLSFFSG